jgi:hypothetical protein
LEGAKLVVEFLAMWRALALTCWLASPVLAQIGPYVNPYNPYASAAAGGHVQMRPFVSLDRLNLHYQTRVSPSSRVMVEGADWNVASPVSQAAAFRIYPHYPALNSARTVSRGFGKVAARTIQPRPFTAPRPVELACDPYNDNDGCLSEYAGWDP